MTTPDLYPFLAAQSTLALATVNADGTPEAAPLFYVHDEALNLYWLSSPTSRHSLNLTHQRKVAATIYPTVWEWTAIQGLQVEGDASALTDEAGRAVIIQRYCAKFTLPASFDTAIASSTLYQLRPRWWRWLDNSFRFGYKVEWHC